MVHAVATNDAGLTSTSSKVRFTVGEFGVKAAVDDVRQHDAAGDVQPARRPELHGQRGRRGRLAGARTSTAPCSCRRRTPENFEAIVKVASFDGTHAASKAGIMVRNDITQASTSPGYMVFGEKGNGETEFMHDAAGNGQVNNAGEPVATGCGTGTQPNWLKVQKKDKVFTVWCSRDGVDLDAGGRAHRDPVGGRRAGHRPVRRLAHHGTSRRRRSPTGR